MGTSYSTLSLTTDAQRLNYLDEHEFPLRDRERLRLLIKPSGLTHFTELVQMLDTVFPRRERSSNSIQSSCRALKLWCEMRNWSQSTYSKLKKEWCVALQQQLDQRAVEVEIQLQHKIDQIRENVLKTLEMWVNKEHLTHHQNSLVHARIKTYHDESVLKRHLMPNDYDSDALSEKVLGHDWRLVWNALAHPVEYVVPGNHRDLGGSRILFVRELVHFITAGSCMSYGGDNWGGISNKERNRRERARPATHHYVFEFQIKIVKY